MDIHPNTQDVQQQLPDNLILKMLHDDELYLIFKLLNVMDLMEAEKVCQRFKVIAQEVYKSHKVLDFDHLRRIRKVKEMKFKFTVPVAMEIAFRVRSYVEKLTFDLNEIYDRFGSYDFWKDFTNLQEISVDNLNFKHMNNESLRNILKTLKNVELIYDPPDEPSFLDLDNSIVNFLNIPQLEELKLICFDNLEGKFLFELSNITVLSLQYSRRINSQLFCQFCDKKPNLRSLNIIGCTTINTMCLKSIAANLKNLEELSLSFNYRVDSSRDYFVLADLTKLKHLELNGESSFYSNNNSDIMYKLLFAISTKNKLETVMIRDNTKDPAAAEDMMKKAIQSLKHLKKLDVFSIYDWKDVHLSYLSCEKTLQRLIICCNYNITSQGLSQLIARCPSINFINITVCNKIDETLVDLILPHLKTRSHMLVLNVVSKFFPKDKYEKYGKYFGINPSKLILTFDYD